MPNATHWKIYDNFNMGADKNIILGVASNTKDTSAYTSKLEDIGRFEMCYIKLTQNKIQEIYFYTVGLLAVAQDSKKEFSN